MDNMNNNSSKENLNKKQKSALLVSIIILLAISFCGSYFITDYLTRNENSEAKNENAFANN